ncbi:xanthine dehydrogenase accessory protein XdhC [Afipia felis]|uniref:Xanthine dehydrogenase accessory protein XdhC n=2 Tax=Afipia felis TaxID=1035 RepID=A0A380W4S2_AFIFE|nr:xanthine dehydrogenase accessory protein XdhC [Afipia felis]EKS31101.1 xanthine dehydrogenase accessory protein XdhC [Afipia felis ATCC 53690]SUU75845.1 xanthine dehydrogenase accessory protein XdhC [Afipia felis]SUU83912.1 xanthine dehydrogenase accessory protein XdhC [Afipia felis]
MAGSINEWLKTGTCAQERAILVQIVNALGSTPRDSDAVLIVTSRSLSGTIGGGALEWTAVEHAREMIEQEQDVSSLSIALGPFLGQCCGGHVTLDFRNVNSEVIKELQQSVHLREAQWPKVLVFGAGHVGRAIARAFGPLPFDVHLIDTRAEEVATLPSDVFAEVVEDPVDIVEKAEPGSIYLILTHSHTIDFLVGEAVLNRQDALYVGMIGSKSKRARYRSWYTSRGNKADLLSRLTLPIGSKNVRDKRPEIIAALVAAEIITTVHMNQSQEEFLADERRSAMSSS